jgi:hypothetical protein
VLVDTSRIRFGNNTGSPLQQRPCWSLVHVDSQPRIQANASDVLVSPDVCQVVLSMEDRHESGNVPKQWISKSGMIHGSQVRVVQSFLLCVASRSDRGSTVLLSIYLDDKLILIDLPSCLAPTAPMWFSWYLPS